MLEKSLHPTEPIYFPLTAPYNYQIKVFSRIPKDLNLCASNGTDSVESNVDRMRNVVEQQWVEASGVPVSEAKCSIIVPIHNEHAALPSMLAALHMTCIPHSASVATIFITNSCTDTSYQIVAGYLKEQGKLTEVTINKEKLGFNDSAVDDVALYVKVGNREFVLLNTKTRGKANALNIGNQLALARGDKIALSTDANNYLEPLAIPYIFGEAYNSIVKKVDSGAVFDGIVQAAHTPLKECENTPIIQKVHGHTMCGWLMAWDTEWLQSVGGVPEVACEDYALGVLAELTEREHRHAYEARIWGYTQGTLTEKISAYQRSVRGRLQLLQQYEDTYNQLPDILKRDRFYMRQFHQRFDYITSQILRHPQNAMSYLAQYALSEYALISERRKIKHNPKDHSWRPINSTKDPYARLRRK